MPNAIGPQGFKPSRYLNGAAWNGAANMYYIPQADTNQYNVGDAVKSVAGADPNGLPAVTKALGTDTVRGVIIGCLRQTPNNPSLVGINLDLTIQNIPATKLQSYWVLVVDDPQVVFELQDDGGTLLAAPTLSSATPSTTGGTLAAGTYFYKVTALNANGETVGSNELSATTTGTTSSVALVWTAVSGATSYRVYRGTTANGENVFYAPGNVTTYTDTNAASTAGTPPGVTTASTALTAAASNKNASFTVVNPTAPAQNSATVLNTSSVATTQALNLKLLGLVQKPNNAFGAYAVWVVKFNQHELMGNTAGV